MKGRGMPMIPHWIETKDQVMPITIYKSNKKQQWKIWEGMLKDKQ